MPADISMTLPPQHRTKLHSSNPIERLNGEIKRRTEVVAIFPNEDAIVNDGKTRLGLSQLGRHGKIRFDFEFRR